MSELILKVLAKINQNKGNVVSYSQYPAPADKHLLLVCVEIREGEYAVWNVNLEVALDYADCGCYNGDYATQPGKALENRSNAMRYFASRLDRVAKLAAQ